MSYELMGLLISSITAPTIYAVLKFKVIERNFLPFVTLICVWFITDFLDFIFFEYYTVAAINNIHFFFESQLVLLQFKLWGCLKTAKIYKALAIAFAVFWIGEMVYIRLINYALVTYFVCLYSFVYALLSIQMLNRLVTNKNIKTTKPIFFICSAFILYFSFTSVMMIFRMPVLGINDYAFITGTYFIMYLILFIFNLSYARAIYLMPLSFQANQRIRLSKSSLT